MPDDVTVEERTLRFAYQPGWEARHYNRLRDLVAELAGEGAAEEFIIGAVADGLDDAGDAWADTTEALDEQFNLDDGVDDDG